MNKIVQEGPPLLIHQWKKNLNAFINLAYNLHHVILECIQLCDLYFL